MDLKRLDLDSSVMTGFEVPYFTNMVNEMHGDDDDDRYDCSIDSRLLQASGFRHPIFYSLSLPPLFLPPPF